MPKYRILLYIWANIIHKEKKNTCLYNWMDGALIMFLKNLSQMFSNTVLSNMIFLSYFSVIGLGLIKQPSWIKSSLKRILCFLSIAC